MVTTRDSVPWQVFLLILYVGRLQNIMFGKAVLLLIFFFLPTHSKIHTAGYKFKNNDHISEKKNNNKIGGITLPGMW